MSDKIITRVTTTLPERQQLRREGLLNAPIRHQSKWKAAERHLVAMRIYLPVDGEEIIPW